MPDTTRILLIEDVPTDAELNEREVRRVLPHSQFLRAETGEELVAALESFRPDVVLSDYRLPRFDGMAALKLAQEHAPATPFIIVTGSMNEETAVECMKAGAWDYVIKEHIRRLGPAVVLCLEQRQLRQERQRVAAALRESEARFRTLLQDAQSVAVQGYGPEGVIHYWNRASEQLYGYSAEEALGRNILDLIIPPEMRAHAVQAIRQMAKTGVALPAAELSLVRKDGTRVAVYSSHSSVQAQGQPPELFCIDIDLTEYKRSEQAARQANAFSDAMVDSVPGAFYMLDVQGRYVRWNAYQRDEIVGKPDHAVAETSALDTIHPDDREMVQARISNVLVHNAVETVEGRVLLRGGPAFRWFLMTGRRSVIDGQPFLVGIGIDITDRKRAEAELKQKYAEVERFNAVTVDRELRMVDLKREVNALRVGAGLPEKYRIVEDSH